MIEKLILAVARGETLVLWVSGPTLEDFDREDPDRGAKWWVPEGTPILDCDGICVWEGEPHVVAKGFDEDEWCELELDVSGWRRATLEELQVLISTKE